MRAEALGALRAATTGYPAAVSRHWRLAFHSVACNVGGPVQHLVAPPPQQRRPTKPNNQAGAAPATRAELHPDDRCAQQALRLLADLLATAAGGLDTDARHSGEVASGGDEVEPDASGIRYGAGLPEAADEPLDAVAMWEVACQQLLLKVRPQPEKTPNYSLFASCLPPHMSGPAKTYALSPTRVRTPRS